MFFVLLLMLAGCASPAHRIRKNPELFASFPAEVQALVEKGEVGLGFTPAMVTMSLGEPNRVYARQSMEETHEVWSYTGRQTTTDRQRVNARFRYRGEDGEYRRFNDWVWVDVERETEYERTRVEFSDGKVIAIERLQR